MEQAMRLRRPLKSILKQNSETSGRKQGIRFAEPAESDTRISSEMKASGIKTSSPYLDKAYGSRDDLKYGNPSMNTNQVRTHQILQMSPIKTLSSSRVESPILQSIRGNESSRYSRSRKNHANSHRIEKSQSRHSSGGFKFLDSLNNIGSRFMDTILQTEPESVRRETVPRVDETESKRSQTEAEQKRCDVVSQTGDSDGNLYNSHRTLVVPESQLSGPENPETQISYLAQRNTDELPKSPDSLVTSMGLKGEIIAQMAELKEMVEGLSKKVIQLEREKQELSVEHMVEQNRSQALENRLASQEVRIKKLEDLLGQKDVLSPTGQERVGKRKIDEDSDEIERKVKRLQSSLVKLKDSNARHHRESGDVKEAIRKNSVNKY
ncbi:unnamed protein product [Kuraishia capsulata CBS 1993]|uniref:Uncharacterized protein n=1 Tax=Kuraishia capsulata CBS 1993 TaxID=1382522 RepID=W6MQH0_9ASCO|nr:uncharacterized protein KUCA_T00003485001 [Kuraishia capsulata CBS 1993]CDK27507.1 unnamed protein product [Kuraishia capsulata CBS 1993]